MTHICVTRTQWVRVIRDQSKYGFSQWETTLQCNAVSNWQSRYPEWCLVIRWIYKHLDLFSSVLFFLPHLISEMKNKTDCSLKAFYMTKYFVLRYFMDAVSGLDSSEWKIAYENCNMFDFLIHGNNINSTVLSKWSCIGHIFLLHAQSVMSPSIYKQHSYNNGSVSNHRQLVCLFNTLFWLTTNKTWNLQIKSPAWHAQSVTMIYHCYVLMKDICFLLDRQIQLVMSVSLWAVYMTMSSDKSLIRSPSRLALTAQRALCMPEAQITAAYWITWARQKYLITDGDHFELNIMLLLTSLLWNAYINYYNIHNRVTRHTTQWVLGDGANFAMVNNVTFPSLSWHWASSTGLTAVSKLKLRPPAQWAVGTHRKGPSRMEKVTSRMDWPIRNSTQIRN